MSGPAPGRYFHAWLFRAALPCLIGPCLVLAPGAMDRAHAQAITPDLFRPVQGGFVSPQDLPMRRTSAAGGDPNDTSVDDQLRDRDNSQDPVRRLGNIPQYGLPPVGDASDSGYDALNRPHKQPKYYPAQAKPKPRSEEHTSEL